MERRSFIKFLGFLSIFNTKLFSQNNNNEKVSFNHGVASGDPTHSNIIIWTKITKNTNLKIDVDWQISNKKDFSNVISNGKTK